MVFRTVIIICTLFSMVHSQSEKSTDTQFYAPEPDSASKARFLESLKRFSSIEEFDSFLRASDSVCKQRMGSLNTLTPADTVPSDAPDDTTSVAPDDSNTDTAPEPKSISKTKFPESLINISNLKTGKYSKHVT